MKRFSQSKFARKVVLGCALAFAPCSAIAQCPPDDAPPSIPIVNLQAGQYNVGLDGVQQITYKDLENKTGWGNDITASISGTTLNVSYIGPPVDPCGPPDPCGLTAWLIKPEMTISGKFGETTVSVLPGTRVVAQLSGNTVGGIGTYSVTISQTVDSRPLRVSGGEQGRDAIDKYLKRRPVPVVLGPNGQLHLVDNHHRTLGVYLLYKKKLLEHPETLFPNYVYYRQIDDLSAYSGSAFWAKLVEGGPVLDEFCDPVGTLRHQYLWPYDRGVLQDPNVTPPPMIPSLRDDILRTISANARAANGYIDFEDDETPYPDYVIFFEEFYWANFLRNRVFLQGADWETRGGNPNALVVFTPQGTEDVKQATKRLVGTAAMMCRDTNAQSLPGWTACPADVLADGVINSSDIGMVLGAWGSTTSEVYENPTVDINQDGIVDGVDLCLVLMNWGICTAP